MKKNSEIMYELALKLADDSTLLEHAMSNRSVYGMLMEDINEDDIEKLRKAVKTAMGAVDANIKASNSLKIASTAQYFEKLKTALKKADALAAKLDLSDPEGVGASIKSFFGKKMDVSRALQAVIDLQNKSNTAAGTIAGAIKLLTKNLDGKVDDEVKLSELDPDKHGLSSDDLKNGVAKAFKGAKPKGFMAKLGALMGKSKFVASIPGAEQVDELPIEELSDELLQLTFGDLKKLEAETTKSASAAEKAVVPTDVIKDVQTSAEEAPPPGKESEDGPVAASAGSEEGKEGDKEGEEKKAEDKGSEGGEGEPGKDADGDELPENPEEESDPAKGIQAAASEAGSSPMSPKDAVSKALSDWEASLSASSQKSLKAKNRNQELKDGIFQGIDKGKEAVQRAVAKAVKAWRASHEETLVKSKKFAKKNFDSLEKMIPDLAAQVLSQTKETRQRKITTGEIKRFVNKRLDSKFYPQTRLYETWRKNAGLLKD